MQRYGSIYKITNLLNGKIYIGQTTQLIERRWKQHCKSTHCFAINRAIQKYGHINFEIVELCTVFDQQELDLLEIFFIKEYNSLAPNGYNLMMGGNSHKHHIDTKTKMSQTRKNNPALWRNLLINRHPCAEETKKKISQANTGKIRTSENKIKLGKSVVRLDKNNFFDKFYATLSFATKDGFLRTGISNVLTKKAETHRGYKW